MTTSKGTVFNISLTTNCLERWHRSLNSYFKSAHPNINTLLNAIHIEHNTASIKIIQFLHKNLPELNNNINLTFIFDNMESYTGVEFLTAIVIRLKIKGFSD
ncbi:hypothetical protein DMUE_0226 [Dictyocoela muelleri]|nr:hypothetical protein DMUE_0226 [Dictyocoela muelleri]